MAAGSRRGGDLVLGGRHLIGICALLVVVLGIVFTLGYLLGRSRYEDQLRAAVATGVGETAAGSAVGAGPAPARRPRAAAPPPKAGDGSCPTGRITRGQIRCGRAGEACGRPSRARKLR